MHTDSVPAHMQLRTNTHAGSAQAPGVPAHVHAHVKIPARVHNTHVPLCMRVCAHTCVCTSRYIHIHAPHYPPMHIHTDVCVCVCVCVYTGAHKAVSACVHLHTHAAVTAHTHTWTYAYVQTHILPAHMHTTDLPFHVHRHTCQPETHTYVQQAVHLCTYNTGQPLDI